MKSVPEKFQGSTGIRIPDPRIYSPAHYPWDTAHDLEWLKLHIYPMQNTQRVKW